MGSTPKPLIGARDRSVAGSFRESSEFARNPDFAFVPGYSDKRRQIDADLSAGRVPSTGLTHRLHWARHAKPSGGADTDLVGFLSRGYVRVTKDNYQSFGIELSPAWSYAADGGVRMGDLELLACPADTAQANEAQVRRAIDAQASDDQTASALHRAGRDLDRAGGLTTATSDSRVEVTKS